MAGETTNDYTLQIQFCGDEDQVEYLRNKYFSYDGLEWRKHNPIGLNIFIPDEILFNDSFNMGLSQKINLGLRCRMSDSNGNYVPYKIIPTPHIADTYYRMSCHEMIFSGFYSGELYVSLDLRTYLTGYRETRYILKKGELFLQLVTPDLSTNFSVEFVDSFSVLNRHRHRPSFFEPIVYERPSVEDAV